MPTLDVFKTDAFGLVAMTDAINKLPHKPMRLGELGLFPEKGIAETKVSIEERNGQLSLIQSKPRGGTADTMGSSKRTMRAVTVPHFPLESTINADEVQGIRAFGSENAAQVIQEVVNERLGEMKASHEVTLERMRAGAVQGLILDADGSTLLNLFTAFGVAQQTAILTPNDAADGGDALRAEIVAIQRLIEAELGAAVITDFRGFCGAGFFDDLRSDLGVVQTLRYADPQSLLGQQANARSFKYAGVQWEEYRGSTGGTPFFADGEAFVVPVVEGLFKTYNAPADFVETVNTLGLPIYAKTAVDPEFQRWVKIHTQSNQLPLCLRPRAVVKVTIGT